MPVRTFKKGTLYRGLFYTLRETFTVRGSKRRGLRIMASPTCRVIVVVVVVEARYSHIVFD